MSTLDLPNLADLLQSTKVKDRNDALTQLEIVAVSNYKLSSKQLRELTTAIFNFINHDSKLFVNGIANNSSKIQSVESRLNRASYYLRLLIEKSINYKLNVKYKVYLDICFKIKDSFYLQNELIAPCSVDFAIITSTIINVKYVSDHFTNKDWSTLYFFIIAVIDRILEGGKLMTNNGLNDKLLVEFWTALKYLLQCDDSTAHTQLFEDEKYFKMLPLLDKTIKCFNKENLLHITLFVVINKLITLLATTDFKYVHRLIKLGLKMMVISHKTHWEKLQDQFLIFINLGSTHNFINLDNLPKIVGDKEIEFTTDILDDSIETQHDEDDKDVVRYNLEILIVELLKSLSSNLTSLSVDHLGLTFSNSNTTWFKLKSIFLKGKECRSWLKYLGIAKLLNSYFALKNKDVLTTSSTESRGRKSKFDVLNNYLTISSDPLDFCNFLIIHKSSTEIQVLGLQLLVFYLESHSIEKDKINQREPNVETVQSTEVTNTTFDFTLTNIIDKDVDLQTVLQHSLAVADSEVSKKWVLLLGRSIISENYINLFKSTDKNNFLCRLLKISLVELNKENYNIACDLIFLIIMECKSNLNKIIDNSIITQIITIIDFAEVSGPLNLCNESFKFWYAVNKILIELNVNRRNTLSQKIDDWIIAKWDGTFKPSFDILSSACHIPEFLKWLSGNSFQFDNLYEQFDLYDDIFNSPMYMQNLNIQLESFITLETRLSNVKSFSYMIDSITPTQTFKFYTRLQETFQSMNTGNKQYYSLLEWLIILSELVSIFNQPSQSDLVEILKYQLLVGVESFITLDLDSDESLSILNILTKSSNIVKNFLKKMTTFPLETILKSIEPVYFFDNKRNTAKRLYDGDELNNEFAVIRENSCTPTNETVQNCSYIILSHEFKPIDQFLQIKLTSLQSTDLSQTDVLNQMISTIEYLKDEYFLQALWYIVESVLPKIDITEIQAFPLIRIVRLFGERLLSNQKFDRNEVVLVIVSKFFIFLIPHLKDLGNDSLTKDSSDIINWLYALGNKLLINTEIASLFYLKFLITYSQYNDENIISQLSLRNEIFHKFQNSTNNIKINTSDQFYEKIQTLNSTLQEDTYSRLFDSFTNAQSGQENAATFILFFSILANSSSVVLRFVIFNLTEYSRFKFMISYLEKGFDKICSETNLKSSKDLYKLVKIDLLRSWWNFNSFDSFPVELFKYSNFNSFIFENYRDMVAVIVSTRSQSQQHSADSITLQNIAKVKETKVEGIIAESLSKIIPLSYSRDGIKNKCFEVLNGYLPNLKEEMKNQLPLIVLEIIINAVVTKESDLKRYSKDTEQMVHLIAEESIAIEIHSRSSISLNSSMDLITRIIQKFHNETSPFWSSQMIYFLIRRVGLLFEKHSGIIERQLVLRQIKLILLIAGNDLLSLDVVNLLISILSPLLKDGNFSTDVMRVFSSFQNLYAVDLVYSKSLDAVNAMVVALFEALKNDWNLNFSFNTLMRQLSSFVEKAYTKGKSSSKLDLVNAGIKLLQNEETQFQISIIEDCLKMHCGFDWIKLCSFCFDLVDDSRSFISNPYVIKKLLQISDSNMKKLSVPFKVWISKCLSSHYGNAGSKNQLLLNEHLEYKGPSEKYLKSHYFEYALEKLIEVSKSSSANDAACAEAVLGVLLERHLNATKELSNLVRLNSILEPLKSYILPLKLSTCVLLNDESEVQYLDYSLQGIIEDFETFYEINREKWCSNIYLAILKEVATYTSLGSIISTFSIQVPEFAASTIPSLICLYLQLGEVKAEEQVVIVLNSFPKLKNIDQATKHILLKIIQSIRIAAKTSNFKRFSNVLSRIDLLEFFKMAAESKLYKFAYMIFEDIYAGTEDSTEYLQNHYSSLQQVYENLDENDLIYGLPEKTGLDQTLKMIANTASSEVQFQYSSACLDTSLKLNSRDLNDSLIACMSNTGLLGLSQIINKNYIGGGDNSFEWSWKLSQWNHPVPINPKDENEIIYKVLKQIHDFPSDQRSICDKSILEIMNDNREFQNEGAKEHRERDYKWLKSLATVSSVKGIICNESYESQRLIEHSDFSMFEDLILAKQATFQILAQQQDSTTDNPDKLWSSACKELVDYNNLARINNQNQKMISSMVMIDSICKKLQNSRNPEHQNMTNLSLFQAAQSMWKQGNTNAPVLMLKELYNAGGVDINDSHLKTDKFLIKAMMVKWMAESRQELASTLMESQVLPTAEKALILNEPLQQSRIFRLLAQFCETQYKSKSLSEHIEGLEKRVNEKRDEIEELRTHYQNKDVSSDEKKDINKFYHKLKVMLAAEVADLKYASDNRKQFSVKAVEYYLESMTFDDFPEQDLDKFFALWLEQSNDDQLNIEIESKLLALPSYKLLSWCAQLMSRLSKENTPFQSILKKLILQMCIDHPHHSLYLLYSLKKQLNFARKDRNILLESKALSAAGIWSELTEQNQAYVQDILIPIEIFSEECIKLAEHKVSKSKVMNLDKLSFGKYWLKELPTIPPPTKSLKIDPTKKYENVPVLNKIENKLILASSGLSLPKIATFSLSDGSTHKILLKHGTDDLRQDSIMEQVFVKVQHIFAKDKECNKRSLSIRTYNAIPLGPTSGIIEFVPNSTSLIDVIRPYHLKYDQLKIEKAREIMKLAQNKDKLERLHEFQKIENKIKPVLRLFFQDNFLTSDKWFESRIKYTHGVATTSIVGHMLGLGDRHCNNILLDKQTGEPIHIDLGVSFDQGKSLPIPETVPFRLTRDIVDGFGITGVEGVFKKSSEHTLRVLRENKDHIISILDVLRWDPLYSWSLSPLRKKRLQEDEAGIELQPERGGSEVGRAVSTVADKLVANGLSTEAAVRELIQEATNSQNLSLIYFGWCPFY
ncbi:TEL1 [Candida pseudojiufengensis]|uniref:TEL1 n=1 Tax=Candida pseudojiufengensis TaxID=497109 RepID=UPI002224471B|nr:TEL1 [Candida pseudojiufengensis]KAI5963104.1 TEL1 [Candida pseudojiufengensis]